MNTLWSGNWIRQSGSQRIIGSFNNAAVGTALGQANGIQALDRSHQVIALCGDGGFNMLMCEFLTAVHHRLPVKVMIFNNSAFGLITLEAESVGLPPFRGGIEFPNPDFAALARACGGHGFTARKPQELKTAINEALAVDGPAIVDAVVVSDELPNLPHLRLGAGRTRCSRKGQGSDTCPHLRVTAPVGKKAEKSPQGRRDAARGDRYAGGGRPALHTILLRDAAAVCSAFV